MKIDPASILPPVTGEIAPRPTGTSAGGFADLLSSAVADVSDGQKQAAGLVQKFASGEEVELHEVMIAVERADLSFRTMMQVRNRLLDAYREIMRMSV
ncbi:MAG: flagellar hook-basal body complex protein FliE [Acidobacteriota bacterium]